MVRNRDIVARVVARGLDPRQVSLTEFAQPGDALGSISTPPSTRRCRSCAATSWTRLPVLEGDRVVGLVTQRDAACALVFRPPWDDDPEPCCRQAGDG